MRGKRALQLGVSVLTTILLQGGCGASAPEPATGDPEPAADPPTAQTAEPQGEPKHRVLLAEWEGPNGGVPPWDAIDNALFEPAFEEAMGLLLAEVQAIADSKDPPTFDNTLVALERSGRPLDRLTTLFFTLESSVNTPEIQKLSGSINPKLTALFDSIRFNKKLFERIDAVYQARDTSGLNAEQKRLVELTHADFVRRGAKLDETKKKRLGDINERLSKLFTDFGNRLQADEDTWVTLGEDDLAGLPDSLVEKYKAAAKTRKVEGAIVVNTRSAVAPFLTFSDKRELRKKVWEAFTKRGDNGNENDTNELITEIVKLRAERAKLLGFESHAHWRLSDTMAKDPQRAMELMMRVWPAAKKRVQREVADMRAQALREGKRITIEPWDYHYYMEKVRKARFNIDQAEVSKYFALEQMIKASYYMAERLYGYAFEEVTGQVPVFHPDVRVFHVTNKGDGSHVGYFFRDDFARQYKRSGAWMSDYRAAHKVDGQVDAVVSNNNNFTKAPEGERVLITLDDGRTLFHEFGHAIHGLIMDVTYPSLGDTPRDFVEFPSQVHENWLLTREILDKFALNEKGEKLPQKLLDKVSAAGTFKQGFATVEYLASAIVDMKLHLDAKGEIDPKAFEKATLKEIGMPREIVMRHRLPQFAHLFSGDAYSAAYYSYLWSDVMAADAWAAFVEKKNPFDEDLAQKFAKLILASGDSFDRAEAFKQFRGREPRVEALLDNRGLR